MTKKKEFLDGNKKQPIHFQKELLVVYTNELGEICVRDKRSDTEIKIDICELDSGGLQFSINGEGLEPFTWRKNKAWRVVPPPVPGPFDED
jgi:hypothetical protein